MFQSCVFQLHIMAFMHRASFKGVDLAIVLSCRASCLDHRRVCTCTRVHHNMKNLINPQISADVIVLQILPYSVGFNLNSYIISTNKQFITKAVPFVSPKLALLYWVVDST
jgi:hypothetical protein